MRRKRRIAKRAGLVLTVGLVVLWLASARWGAAVLAYPAGCVGVYAGFVRVGWDVPWKPVIDEWWVQRPSQHHLPFRWWVQSHEVGFGAGARVAYEVPLWMLVLAVGTPTLWLFRLDRPRVGRCRECGYDVRGLSSGVCPECGAGVRS